MKKIKKGSIKKIWSLYDLYYLKLYNYFYLLTLNQKFSEGLVLGVFKQIIEIRSTYNDKNSFKPWMYRIARNVYFQNKHTIKSYLIEADKKLNYTEDITIYGVNSAKNDSLLIVAMNRLTDSMKEILLLSKFMNYDYDALAEVFNTTISEAQIKVFRVINELRKIYVDLLK